MDHCQKLTSMTYSFQPRNGSIAMMNANNTTKHEIITDLVTYTQRSANRGQLGKSDVLTVILFALKGRKMK